MKCKSAQTKSRPVAISTLLYVPSAKKPMFPYRFFTTGTDAEYPIALYNYQSSRGKEHPREFLKGYKGYLQTDGDSVYIDTGLS